MKILGFTEKDFGTKYICEISADEIAKIFDKSFYRHEGEEFKKFKLGQEINLGQGFDFREQLKRLLESFESSHTKFTEANKTMLSLSQLFIKKKEPDAN